MTGLTPPEGPEMTTPLSLLDYLDALRAAATPGPWQVDDDGEECAVTAGTARGLPGSWRATDRIYTADVGEYSGETEDDSNQRAADAAWIVAASNHTPALVAAVRAVLGLHSRNESRYWYNDGLCAACHGQWPCPTVAAITALADDEDSGR